MGVENTFQEETFESIFISLAQSLLYTVNIYEGPLRVHAKNRVNVFQESDVRGKKLFEPHQGNICAGKLVLMCIIVIWTAFLTEINRPERIFRRKTKAAAKKSGEFAFGLAIWLDDLAGRFFSTILLDG